MLLQVYTRSVIDPLPAPEGDASKAADRQKKKGGKMTDEEIMEKLRMYDSHWKCVAVFGSVELTRPFLWPLRNYCQYRRSKEEIHPLREDWPGVSQDNATSDMFIQPLI